MREQNTSLEDGPHVGVTRAQCEHALGFNCGSNHLLASPWHSSESDLPDSRRRGSYLCSEPFSLLLWKKKNAHYLQFGFSLHPLPAARPWSDSVCQQASWSLEHYMNHCILVVLGTVFQRESLLLEMTSQNDTSAPQKRTFLTGSLEPLCCTQALLSCVADYDARQRLVSQPWFSNYWNHLELRTKPVFPVISLSICFWAELLVPFCSLQRALA